MRIRALQAGAALVVLLSLSACADAMAEAQTAAKSSVVKTATDLTQTFADKARVSDPADFASWLEASSAYSNASATNSVRIDEGAFVTSAAAGDQSTDVNEVIVDRTHTGSGDSYKEVVAFSCVRITYFSHSAKKPEGADVSCPTGLGATSGWDRIKVSDWLTRG